MVLLMLDGGLRPGEVLGLHLDDIAYGRRRVTIRKRDDHPAGRPAKVTSRAGGRPPRTAHSRRGQPIRSARTPAGRRDAVCVPCRRARQAAYPAAVVRRLRSDVRTPAGHPGHPHRRHDAACVAPYSCNRDVGSGNARAVPSAAVRSCKPESTRIYTRVSDAEVRSDYVTALRSAK